MRLYTVVSRRNGSGVHSALLIATDDERILFDPAGSFSLTAVPERGDVHYGITPAILNTYVDYHARETFDLVEQRLGLTSLEAQDLAQAAKAYGAVPRMQCTLSTTRLLVSLPRFAALRVTYFPNEARRAMSRISAVETRIIRQNDGDANLDVLTRANASP